jgi:hypothetical protein
VLDVFPIEEEVIPIHAATLENAHLLFPFANRFARASRSDSALRYFFM